MHGGEQVVAQLGREQLGDVALDDEVAVQVQDLVVLWQELLNQKAVVRLHADVLVVGAELVLPHDLRDVAETQVRVLKAGEEPAHHALVIRRDVLVQNDHIVAARR